MCKSNDTKQIWKIINSLLNKNATNPMRRIFNIEVNGALISDKTTIVNSFNQYFAEVGSKLASKIPLTTLDLNRNCLNVVPNSIILLPTDFTEVCSCVISNLKPAPPV